MLGGIMTGYVCSCPICKKYYAYMPEENRKIVKLYVPDKCPKCGSELEFRGVGDEDNHL